MNTDQLRTSLKERVAQGLNFGIEAVEDVIRTETSLYNEFILLKSKYNDLMLIAANNTLPYEQIELGMNKLRAGLLHLIDALDTQALEKQQIDAGLNIQALPTRRANFFKLLDIHYRNLSDVNCVEYVGGEERTSYGRNAIYTIYQFLRSIYRDELRKLQQDDPNAQQSEAEIRQTFYDYFNRSRSTMQVYFKNIGHMLAYIQESEIEQAFFLDIIRSLFEKTELAMLFYYSISGIDEGFAKRLQKSKIIDKALSESLIDPAHYALYEMPTPE